MITATKGLESSVIEDSEMVSLCVHPPVSRFSLFPR
jgi:hypothetical protein